MRRSEVVDSKKYSQVGCQRRRNCCKRGVGAAKQNGGRQNENRSELLSVSLICANERIILCYLAHLSPLDSFSVATMRVCVVEQ